MHASAGTSNRGQRDIQKPIRRYRTRQSVLVVEQDENEVRLASLEVLDGPASHQSRVIATLYVSFS